MPLTPRFADGKYRDCKWCQGRGCVYCEAEADAEYKRQFPDGPKPIATFDTSGMGEAGIAGLLQSLIGAKAVEEASAEAATRAERILKANPSVPQLVERSEADCKKALADSLLTEVLTENIVKNPNNKIQ